MGLKRGQRSRFRRLQTRELHAMIAYAASLMLSGVPPEVCESALTNFYCSVKKSLHSIVASEA